MSSKFIYSLLLIILCTLMPSYHHANASVTSTIEQPTQTSTTFGRTPKKKKTKKRPQKRNQHKDIRIFNILGLACLVSAILGLGGLLVGWITLFTPAWAVGLSLSVLSFLVLMGFLLFNNKKSSREGRGIAFGVLILMLLVFINGLIALIMGFALGTPLLWIVGISLVSILLLLNMWLLIP